MRRLSAPVLLFILTLSIPATCAAAEELPSSWEEALRSSSLVLYVNPETAEVAVLDTRTDHFWFSNPPDRAVDPIANPINVSRLSSQVIAYLYSPSDQAVVLDSHTNAGRKDQVEIDQRADVLRVTYRMNNFERGEQDIPLVVGAERFQRIFLDNATDEERAILLERFTYREEEGVYRRYPLPAFLVPEFIAIMDRVGYTAEDLQFDNAANEEILTRLDPDSYETTLPLRMLRSPDSGRASVAVTLEYRLDGDELTVTVPADGIVGDPVYPLHAVRVLPYFGAAGPDETGYMVLPDGEGTLIYLNNGKTGYQPVQLPVYGTDTVNDRRERSTVTAPVCLPLFGIKRGEHALAVEIGQGAAIAEINADIAGRLHSYNWTGVEFQLKPLGRISIGSGFQETSKLVFPDERYAGELQLRFAFLHGDAAGYTGIADWYRYRLAMQQTGERAPPDLSVQQPVLDLVGAVEKQRSVLGLVIPYAEPATTFEQAERILEQLASYGIRSSAIRFRGWFNGDIEHGFPGRISVVRSIGGSDGLTAFLEASATYGAQVYPDVYFTNVFESGNGFSARRDAVRFIDQTIARFYRFNAATLRVDLEYPPSFLLSPAKLADSTDRFFEQYEQFGHHAIALADLGRTLTGDFDENAPVDRGRSQAITVATLASIRNRVDSVLLDGANAYAVPYADIVAGIPLGSSRFTITDEDIPLLPLVLRGLTRFAYAPINRANDLRIQFLRTVETGAELSLLWTWANASVFKNTPYDHFYSTEFSAWIEEAVSYFRELSDVRRAIGNRSVTERVRVGDDAYRVQYGSDLLMYVNYSDQSIIVDGVTIDGRSYELIRQTEEAVHAR